MKAVLMSIKPKWCEKIFNGEKTVEVRKTAPKLEPPYKVYVYRTKCKRRGIIGSVLNVLYYGKVIGEFVCDKVEKCNSSWLDGEDKLKKTTCLDDVEIMDYVEYTGKKFFLWHITAPKLYDKPKNIKEFRKLCIDDDLPCTNCPKCRKDKSGYIQCFNTVNHPPQSWCYVVEE